MHDNDQITEFVDIDVEELHLVGSPANRFPALMAKARPQKGTKMGKAKRKELLKQLEAYEALQAGGARPTGAALRSVHGVDLAGAGASTIGRLGRRVLAEMAAAVSAAKATLETAPDTPMAKMRAREELRQARYRLVLAKSIAQENGRVRGDLLPGGYGIPGLVPVIKEGSSHTLAEDTSLGYR